MKLGRSAALALCGALGLGLAALWINSDLPIVRNGEAYAQAAYSLIASDLDPRPVVADPALSCGKPIGFPLLSVPLVRGLGANRGLMVVSFLGTVLFAVLACLLMARLNAVFAADRDLLAIEIVLLWFNPLMIYQFWSAYPDTLFAALVLAALLLVDDALHGGRERLWTAFVASLTIVAAVLLKYYAVVLIVILPLAYLCSEAPRSAASRRRRRLWFAVATLLPVAFVATGVFDLNPLMAFSGRGGGTDQYLAAAGDVRLLLYLTRRSLVGFAFAIVLVFNVLAILFARTIGFRVIRGDRRRLYYLLASSVFLLGLLPFQGTSHNLRYFIPILPLLAVALARQLHSLPAPVRRGLLVTFLLIQTVLVLNFNGRGLNERWADLNRTLPRQLDNVRMAAHIERRALLDRLEHSLPEGAVLYLVSDYYDGCVSAARARLWREIGLDPNREIDIRPAPLSTVDQSLGRYYVYADKLRIDNRLKEASAADLGRSLAGQVTDMGYGLFRVDP